MKKFAALALASLSLLPLGSFAQPQPATVQGSGPSPYVECGIGAAIFPNTSWAAAVSNVIWDLGSTALSSALSSPEQCNPKKVRTAKLILETLPQLEQDVAMGEGKYLSAMMATAGCDAADQSKVAAHIRGSYGEALANDGYATQSRTDRANAFYQQAKSALATTSCPVIL